MNALPAALLCDPLLERRCGRRLSNRSSAAQGCNAFGGPARGPASRLAEPIVQLLMHRDRMNETTVRRLLQQTSAAQRASRAKNDPRADDPNTIVRLLQLHRTARLARGGYDRALLAQLPGMTCARCAVLIHLAQHKVFNQAALAQILDIRPTTLVRLLDWLEAAGFVARMPDPDDRRAHVLALTAKALPIIERIHDLTTRETYDDLG
jgi:DNA-binding MarR family transcriptional regulator